MARTKAKRGERCAWEEDEDAQWHTTCGHIFEFNDGGPTENQMRYCGYCGAPLKVVRYKDAA